MAEPAGAAAALQQVAAAAAATLLQARSPPAAAAQALQRELFPPPCCYLALAVSAGGAMLLSANLLAAARSAAEAAGVHTAAHCFAGAALQARRPMACSLPAASSSGSGADGSQLLAHADLAAAAQRWGAASFLCLPFHVPQAANGAEASSTSERGGSAAAALLLGTVAAPDAAQNQRQRQHIRTLLALAAALVQHTQLELRQAADALTLLQLHLGAPVAPQPVQPEPGHDQGLQEVAAALAQPPRAMDGGALAGEARAGSRQQLMDGPERRQAGAADAAAAGASQQATAAHAAAAGASQQAGGGLAAAVGAPPTEAQQEAAQAQQQGGASRWRLPPFLARLGQVLLLCWLSLRELAALPAARHAMGLDPLLRFRGGAAPPAPAVHGEQWGLPGRRRGLEDEFAEHHARMLADKVGGWGWGGG